MFDYEKKNGWVKGGKCNVCIASENSFIIVLLFYFSLSFFGVDWSFTRNGVASNLTVKIIQ